jgi:hypothetical protein
LASGRLVEAAPHDGCIPMVIKLYRDKTMLSQAAEDFWSANVRA